MVALLCAFVWAVSTLVVRTQSQKVPPALMNGIRCAVAGALFWMLLPFGPPLSTYGAVTGTEWLLLLGGLTIGVAVGDTIFLASIKEMGVSRSMPLAGTHPLTTMFFEWVFLGNPFSPTFLLGSCCVVLGVVLLSGREEETQMGAEVRVKLGVTLALFAASLWGVSTVMLKPAIAHMTVVQANSVRMPAVALLLFATRAWTGPVMRLRDLDRRTLLIVAGSGAFGMGLGSMLFLKSIELVGPAKTATLAATCPVFAVIMAVAFLKEKMTLRVASGGLLCLAGVYLVL
jgi:DME family drug/metabolite transporter